MKLYTNEFHEIVGYKTPPENYKYEYEVDDNFNAGRCDSVIFGYKYEPQYEQAFDENGEIVIDAFGQALPKLDENGEKIPAGISWYPFVDPKILDRIQEEHDRQEAAKTELQLALCEQYEANLNLENSVTTVQLALCDMYEGKVGI